MSASIQNAGDESSAATTVRYYRSTDSTITTSDTEEGSDELGALDPGETISIGEPLTAPADPGTYYYGVCVDSVTDESDTTNNCSGSLAQEVLERTTTPFDLQVGSPTVDDSSLEPGASFLLSVTVSNAGEGTSAFTTLRYYRSTDVTITTSDTEVETDSVLAMSASGTSAQSVGLTAPSTAGTYYYGACVDTVTNESDTTNNCSSSVSVVVSGATDGPDLEVAFPEVDDSSPVERGRFTLYVTVGNFGDEESAATTLRYYQSTDATISSADTEVGTGAVGAMGSLWNSNESITLTAPSTAGTYYYGACVDAVADESDTTDNCTRSAVTVEVVATTVGSDLVVGAPTVGDPSPETGATFRIAVTVRNQGAEWAPATTVRFYRSTDATITTSDTEEQETERVGPLRHLAGSFRTILVTAPASAGTYYYGACVDLVSGELDTTNNCSSAVSVVVSDPAEGPDLLVRTPWVDDISPVTGESFTLFATVQNSANESSVATTLRYYRSADATITTSDTEVGTDSIGALSGSGTSAESVDLTAPSTVGTYYYGACVDSVTDESDTTNNCSSSVSVVVSEPLEPYGPDLEVDTPEVNDSSPETGASFTLSATVRNAGDESSAATTLRYYRSADATITTSDTEVGTDSVSALSASATSSESVDLTAPSTAGTYHYGACVDSVTNEWDATNNCSSAVSVVVSETAVGPDLRVGTPSVDDGSVETGASFTLSATVRNSGDENAVATTLRYYRSTNTTISRTDTEVGTDSVGALSVSATSSESVDLTAPSTGGTYYYGACVDSVTDESNTTNNCSSSVSVVVSESVGSPGTKAPSPAQVTGVVVTPGIGELAVTWTAVSDASGYRVQWKTGDENYDESRQAEITGGETTDNTISGLQPGIEYAVRVIATKDNADDGTPSAETSGTPKASSPAQVTGIVVTPGVGELAVTWTAVSDASGYRVQWKTGDENYDESRQAEITGGETTDNTISGLQPGIEYAVRVIATKDNADDGTPSAETSGTPKASSPAQVTGIVVTPGVGELAVTWTAVSDASGYRVQWKTGDENYDESRQAEITGGETTDNTISGLQPGIEYAVRVIATKDNADDGTPSAEASGTPKASSPAQVTGIVVTPGVGELAVTWTAVSDASGYRVQWKTGDENYDESRQAEITGGETTDNTISGLQPGIEYAVRVIATKDNADDGTPSAEASGTPKASSPAQVTGIVVTPGVGELAVTWTAVSDASGYRVQWKTGDENYDESRQAEITGGETTDNTISGLQPGIEYAVRVIATKDNADDGTPSAEASGTPQASSPTQVTGVVVTLGAGELAVTWTAVSDADGYWVQWKSGEENYDKSRQAEIADGKTVNHTITKLQPGITYTVRVIADHADDGTPSVEVTGTPQASSPTQVTGVVVTPGVGELAVTWIAVSDADGYWVQWKSGEENYDKSRQAEIVDGETVNHTITGLTAGTEYAIQVIATIDQADDGTPSAEVSSIAKAAPPAKVTGVQVAVGVEQLGVSWTAVSDARGYKVQWKSGSGSYDETRQALIIGLETVNYMITGLQPGIEYAVRIVAMKDHADDGIPSAEVTGTPKALSPDQVMGIVITPGVGELAVAWKADSNADGYKVQWKSGSEDYDDVRQAITTDGETTSHTITDLMAGTEYTVRVIASRAHADAGLPSKEVTDVPNAQPAAKVTGVSVKPGVEELEVSWDAVSDASGYKVQWKSGSQDYDESREVALLSGETTRYTIIDLIVDTEYTLRVIATREHADDGEPSNEVTGTPARLDPDVNSDGMLGGDDAQVMYQAYASEERVGDGESGGTAESRRTLLSGLAATANPTDDDLRAMLRKAHVWKVVGLAHGGDINEDGVIDGDDAFVMYYAYEFADLVGDGETGGTARHRQHLLAPRSNKDNPTDEDLKKMLRRANKLKEEFG